MKSKTVAATGIKRRKGHLTAELLTANKEPLGWCILNRPQVVHFNRPVTRPAADKRQVIRDIFWVLDNGAKWKDLPEEFGSKSAVYRWFKNGSNRACLRT
jgi:transposase